MMVWGSYSGVGMDVLQQVIEWAKNLPPWQSDAVRLLLKQDRLTDAQVQEHAAILKASKGIAVSARAAIPISAADTNGEVAKIGALSLKTMRDLENVNAIKPGQRIDFGTKGVTLVYGGNGSGKSGYARVLKRACGERARAAESIMPNVFGQPGAGAVAKASFVFEADGVDLPCVWEDGKSSPSNFLRLAAFDSKCERVYVDEENDVIYRPYGLDVFDRLGAHCKLLAAQLTVEHSALPVLPEFYQLVSDKSQLKKKLTSFNAASSAKAIDEVSRYSTEQEARRLALIKQQAGLVANDPQKMAQALQLQLQRFRSLQSVLTSLAAPLRSGPMSILKTLESELGVAREAVVAASTAAFQGEPLPGVGGEVWKTMFLAAKKFSEDVAYSGKTFPVVGKDSLCVLCQQPLAAAASDRLSRFWDFIEKDASRTATEKEAALAAGLRGVKSLSTATLNGHSAAIEEVEGLKPGFKNAVEAFKASIEARKNALGAQVEKRAWDSLPVVNEACIGELDALLAVQEAAHKDLSAKTSNSAELGILEIELVELEARKAVSTHLPQLIAHIHNLKLQKQLADCISETNTRSISDKASKVAEAAVTEALAVALKRELELLGLNHIDFEVAKRVKGGATLHKLKFSTKTSENVPLSKVLSEGEQRVVGMASFLAELQTGPNISGVVFDDPVSSLDHLRKSKIAARLVTEGLSRQVIIFTHDIELFMDVLSEAGIQRVSVTKLLLRRSGTEVGICEKREPEKVFNVDTRANILDQKIKQAEQALQKGNEDRYRELEKSFYGDLRDTWEQSIEEFVFQRVVKRFIPDIETKKLGGVVFENPDFLRVTNGMTIASRFVHSAPGGKSTPAPDVAQLKSSLKDFTDFVADLKIRQDAAEKQRKALLAPPK